MITLYCNTSDNLDDTYGLYNILKREQYPLFFLLKRDKFGWFLINVELDKNEGQGKFC